MIRYSQRQRGFTLLELVLVLLVIGLAVAVTYPSFSRGTSSLRLRSSSRDILNTLRLARETAITRQSGTRVMLDRETQKVSLTDEYGDGGRTFEMPKDIKIDRLVFAGEEILEGPLVIRFLPNGSSDTARILLRSTSTGATLGVITDPITGGARIVTNQTERQP